LPILRPIIKIDGFHFVEPFVPKTDCKKNFKNQKACKELTKSYEYWQSIVVLHIFKYLKLKLVDSSILMFGNTWNWLVFLF
jgi:hypothetical protein